MKKKNKPSLMEAIFGLGPNDVIKLELENDVPADAPTGVLKLKGFKVKKDKPKKKKK